MKKWMKWNKESAIVIILAGILCMVIVWPAGENKSSGTTLEASEVSERTSESSVNLYIENQEQRLKRILEQVDGVGKIQVMIRASASKEYVVEKDRTTGNNTVNETDAQGGSRQSREENQSEVSVYTTDGSGKDVPWVVKEIEPEIEGVVVAAEGGGNEIVASEITQAVQVLFDIPIHKIKVVKMKGE